MDGLFRMSVHRSGVPHHSPVNLDAARKDRLTCGARDASPRRESTRSRVMTRFDFMFPPLSTV